MITKFQRLKDRLIARDVTATGTVMLLDSDVDLHRSNSEFDDLLLDFQELPTRRDFHVKRRVGSGRQGVVFEVVSHGEFGCETRYALKVFNPRLFRSYTEYQEDLQRIARQAGALQQMYHPNLVHCESFHTHGSCGLKLMELVDGINLSQMLHDPHRAALQEHLSATEWEHINDVIFSSTGGMQPGMAFYILRKVLRGLERLHRVGYIHCDIKPDNVMVDRFGTVKLIDFGRAVPVDGDVDFLMGSPMYMAPEVLQRENLSPLADLYGAGFVILELMHGDYLVPSDSSATEILEFKLSLPERLTDYLPPRAKDNEDLVSILRRLLAIRPEERFHSATEADIGADGAHNILRQLVMAELDADYGRELENFVNCRLAAEKALGD